MTEQTLQAAEKTAHVVEKSAHVVEETARIAREELDWATVREAAVVAFSAAVKFTQWWLCGRGLHAWRAWEYDDGTVLDECASCGRQREPEAQ